MIKSVGMVVYGRNCTVPSVLSFLILTLIVFTNYFCYFRIGLDIWAKCFANNFMAVVLWCCVGNLGEQVAMAILCKMHKLRIGKLYSRGSAGGGRAPADGAHRCAVFGDYFPWLLEIIFWWQVVRSDAPFSPRAAAVKSCAGNSHWHLPRSSAHRGIRGFCDCSSCSFSSIVCISVDTEKK